MVIQVERDKFESLQNFVIVADSEKNSQETLPSSCANWIKATVKSSTGFVEVCTQDFRPKLAKHVVDLEQEHREALQSLKEASEALGEPSNQILSALSNLSNYLNDPNPPEDPWINELTVRHFSARLLDSKATYLEILYRVYSQARHLNNDLEERLTEFSSEFLSILERFSLAVLDEKEPTTSHFLNSTSPFSSGFNEPKFSTWQIILKSYSLDYDWKLQCPPLDGFLSTLYTHLKSLGAPINIITPSTSCSGGLPQIFPDSALKFGFLQKSVSGLLSRSWQPFFAVLQPATGFLHLYKVNSSPKSCEGNLLVPTPGTLYTKASLHDLNLLAAQFFLSSPHQPAAISPQTLTPTFSVKVANCKAVASDPASFTFSIRSQGEKINLRAFCEEELVNWVIFLNEQRSTTKNEAKKTPKSSESPKSSEYSSSPKSPSPKSLSDDSNSSETSSEALPSAPAHAPIVDLENPWN